MKHKIIQIAFTILACVVRADDYVANQRATFSVSGSMLYATNSCTAKLVKGYSYISNISNSEGNWFIGNQYYGLPVVEIGDAAFRCSALNVSSVVVPSTVTNVGDYAFQRALGSALFVLSEGVRRIGDGAFSWCVNMGNMQIPSTVCDIGDKVFVGCSNLVSIVVDANNQWYRSDAGLLYDKSGRRLLAAPPLIESVRFLDTLETIDDCACYGSLLRSCSLPVGVTGIGQMAFAHSARLTSVTIPDTVINVGEGAFMGCAKMKKITFPRCLRTLGAGVLSDCVALETVTFKGVPPDSIEDAEIPSTTLIRYPASLEKYWKQVSGQKESFDDDGVEPYPMEPEMCCVVVSNVVVHYVLNSVRPEIALPISEDTSIVNVMTEIKGGNVAIPSTWSQNYLDFATKFGSDFTKALMKPTGKCDGSGSPMLVWQDYVAGTDPTDENDVFKASVTIVDGRPVVSYTPELSAAEKALRKYTTWGKARLQDKNWVEVQSGHEGDYNFFKVTVEMK